MSEANTNSKKRKSDGERPVSSGDTGASKLPKTEAHPGPVHSTKQRVIKPASLWNFAVDYNDHFETPVIAYSDITPLLHTLSSLAGKADEELTIYDPYWCEGSVVGHLGSLGFQSVINRNRDFYMDIKKRAIPGNAARSLLVFIYRSILTRATLYGVMQTLMCW
jgi:hypothetical protein